MIKQLLLLVLIVFGIHTHGISQIDSTYQDIDEVVIKSNKKKNIVFEDPKFFIVDFSMSETRTILLMKNLGKYFLYELDQNMQFRYKLHVKVNANSLFDDCFGNTHLVTKDSVYFILNDDIGLFLTETHPRVQFMAAMKRCAGATSNKILMDKHNYNTDYQTFYTVDRDSGYKHVVYEINDSTLASSLPDVESSHELTRYRGWRLNDNEVRKGYIFNRRIRQNYNPLFAVNDTLYFFNHFEGRMDVMSDEGVLIRSKEIDHHKKKGWKKKVYSDKGRKSFHAVLRKNGVQNLIGLALTEDEQNWSSKITKHSYPEKVIVRNGYAYYLYKPNVDANLNKLYQQKL